MASSSLCFMLYSLVFSSRWLSFSFLPHVPPLPKGFQVVSKFQFKVIYQSKKSAARVGKIYTPHGEIDTPNFVAVGTNGTLKALDSEGATSLGLQLMFCNTYHLLLQPGTQVIQKAGGLHKFINREGPIITDSGG